MEGFSLQLDQAGSLLANRSFRRLWASQFAATAGIYGLGLASVVLVEERTHSSVWTALTILSAIAPAVLGSLVAGPVVDRVGRVRALVGSHLGRALVALAFWAAATLLSPPWDLPAVLSATALVALLTQFAFTSELALVPDLVGEPRLMAANALLQLSMLVAEGLGAVVLAPLLIKVAGVPAMGLLAALLCAMALILVLPLPRDEAPASTPRQVEGRRVNWAALGSDLRAGWRAIVHDRILLVVVLQATLAATLLLVLISLFPGLVSRHLGLGAEDSPFVLVPGGLGFVVGAVLVSRRQGLLSRQAWIAVGLAGVGVCIGLVAVLSDGTERLWPVVSLLFGAGLALALIIIPARTSLQERPPAELRGRVIAAQLALGNAAALLPLLLGGSLADQVGIRPVMGVLALLAFLAGVVGLWFARR